MLASQKKNQNRNRLDFLRKISSFFRTPTLWSFNNDATPYTHLLFKMLMSSNEKIFIFLSLTYSMWVQVSDFFFVGKLVWHYAFFFVADSCSFLSSL